MLSIPHTRQPDYLPTNKLMVGAGVSATTSLIIAAFLEVVMAWAGEHAVWLTGPSMQALLIALVPQLVGLGAGWLTPDRANEDLA